MCDTEFDSMSKCPELETAAIVLEAKTEAVTTELSSEADRRLKNVTSADCNSNIPNAPPPPPPGFLMPEKTSTLTKNPNAATMIEKPKPMSATEKALIKQLESVSDPTFVGFLNSQMKVKSHSRDRSETEHEM